MTYCIGWKSSKSVFIIADTARTLEHNSDKFMLKKTVSSFSEASINENGIAVEEWVHKVLQVDRKVILAFAGDINKAFEVYDLYKKYFSPEYILESFQLAANAIRSENGYDVEFLIGFYKDGAPKLYSFNKSNNAALLEENGMVQIGSMSNSHYKELADRFYAEHLTHLQNCEEQFYQALAYFQHLGIHEHTFNYNAGGIYSGIYLNKTGAKWMEDTAYLVYDKNVSNPYEIKITGRVQVFVRYNTLVYHSTISNSKEIFINTTENQIYKNSQVHDDLIKLEAQSLSRVFSFLCINDRTIAVIKTDECNCNHLFCELVLPGGDIRMGVRANLLLILKGNLFPKNKFINIFWDYAKKDTDENAMKEELIK